MYELYVDGNDGYQEVGKYQNQYDMFKKITSDMEKKYAYVYDDRVNIPFSSDIGKFVRTQYEYNREVEKEEMSFYASTEHRIPDIIARDMTYAGTPPRTQEHRDVIRSYRDEVYRIYKDGHMEKFKERLKKLKFKDYLH